MLKLYVPALCAAMFVSTPILAAKAGDRFHCDIQKQSQNGNFLASAYLRADRTASSFSVIWYSNSAGPNSASLNLSWDNAVDGHSWKPANAWISYSEWSRAYRKHLKIEIEGSTPARPIFFSSGIIKSSKLIHQALWLDREALIQFAQANSGFTLSISDKVGNSLFENKMNFKQLQNVFSEAVLVQQEIEKIATEHADDCYSDADDEIII